MTRPTEFYLDGAKLKKDDGLTIKGPVTMTVVFQDNEGTVHSFCGSSLLLNGRHLKIGETVTCSFPIRIEDD